MLSTLRLCGCSRDGNPYLYQIIIIIYFIMFASCRGTCLSFICQMVWYPGPEYRVTFLTQWVLSAVCSRICINNKMHRYFCIFFFLQISQRLHILFWPESVAWKQTEATRLHVLCNTCWLWDKNRKFSFCCLQFMYIFYNSQQKLWYVPSI